MNQKQMFGEWLDPGDVRADEWDDLLGNEASDPRQRFGFLSAASHGKWKIWIDHQTGIQIPLLPQRKWGIPILRQPPFLQRVPISGGEQLGRVGLQGSLYFWTRKFWDIHIKWDARHKALPPGIIQRRRTNFLLERSHPEEWSRHHRRNLKIARKNALQLDVISDYGTMLEMYREMLSRLHYRPSRRDRKRLWPILDWLEGEGLLVSYIVRDRSGQPIAGLWGIRYGQRLIFWQPFSTEQGRELRAMYFLIYRLLDPEYGQWEVIDLEGSDLAGVQRFYRGFGANEEHYWEVRYSALLIQLVRINKKGR